MCRRSEVIAELAICVWQAICVFEMAKKAGLQPVSPLHQTYPQSTFGVRSLWFLFISLILSIGCFSEQNYPEGGSIRWRSWERELRKKGPPTSVLQEDQKDTKMIALLGSKRRESTTRLILQDQVGRLTKTYCSGDSGDSVRTSKQ